MPASQHEHPGSGGRDVLPGGVPRRRFLAAAGTGALAISASSIGARPALAASRGGPAAGLPGMGEVWGWQEQLVRYGTRYTGSPGHTAYVDWLASQFGAVPGFSLRTDRLTFNRWLARDYSLRVSVPASVGGSGPVPLTYYYPYSGQTPPAGVTARLVDLGTYAPAVPGTSGTGYTPAFWAPAKGAIALVRTAPSVFSLDTGQTATGGYEPGKTSAQAAADYTSYGAALPHPAWQGIFEPVPLLDARNAGVLGVICVWTGLPDDEVVNQYTPFITPYPAASGLPTPGDPGCPAVWVGDTTGAGLSRLAASGQASATLVLTADITAGAATETVWGWLKGSGNSGQNIIINTHTDGPNATEENGGLGLLALARYLAGLPARNHDMYFALVTGHFQLPQFTRAIPNPKNAEVGNDAISVWMLDHPGIYQAATLGVTVEHLGATMWTNAGGQYAATGGFDWGSTYTMQHNPLNPANAEQDSYLSAVAAVNASGWPDYPVATIRPGAIPLYLGEGAPCTRPGSERSRCARCRPTCCRPATHSTPTCSTSTNSTRTSCTGRSSPSPGPSRPSTPPRRPTCKHASPRPQQADHQQSHPPTITTILARPC